MCIYSCTLQAVLAMKRLGPSTCFPFIVPAAADPAPCPVFAALSYLAAASQPPKSTAEVGVGTHGVRGEAALFSREAAAHWIRRGHISGKGSLHLRGKVAMAMSTDPQFSPMYGGFAALRAEASGSWEWSGKQQPDGKRLILVAMTPRQRHRGHRGELPHDPARRSCSSGPKSSTGGLAAFGNAQECSTETVNVSPWWR